MLTEFSIIRDYDNDYYQYYYSLFTICSFSIMMSTIFLIYFYSFLSLSTVLLLILLQTQNNQNDDRNDSFSYCYNYTNFSIKICTMLRIIMKKIDLY